jgi:hypothetical protein
MAISGGAIYARSGKLTSLGAPYNSSETNSNGFASKQAWLGISPGEIEHAFRTK